MHLDCHPTNCSRCRKPFVCGEAIIIPWRGGGGIWHHACAPMTGWQRIYYCSTACYWRQLRARRRAERMREFICDSCGGRFSALRRARYCCDACRQDAYRQRRLGQFGLR